MASAAELIADIPTIQAFTDDGVPEEDMDKILSAGINAPSAMNRQNWHFTAVTDADAVTAATTRNAAKEVVAKVTP